MPPKTSPFNDPNLEIVSVEDFTPGIYTFSRWLYNPSQSSRAPVGSCSSTGTFRCYAIADYGLVPFPKYRILVAITRTLTVGQTLTIPCMASLMVAPINFVVPDAIVFTTLIQGGAPGGPFQTVYCNGDGFPSTTTTAYTNAGQGGFPAPHLFFAPAITTPGGVATRSLVCVDPVNTGAGTTAWVATPAIGGGSTFSTGAFTPPQGSYYGQNSLFYVNNRMCFVTQSLENGPPFTPLGYGASAIFASDIFGMTNIQNNGPNIFYPEEGITIGTWGSISDGEFFFAYQNGGGVLIYGDIANPSSAVKLPGIAGTGNAIGPAIESNVGLVYVTDSDGVMIWNGGNTTQKISQQIHDDNLFRGSPLGPYTQSLGATLPQIGSQHNDVWGNWCMFANNWMWDTLTGGWWKVEDPAVRVLNQHCMSIVGNEFFYSSEWQKTATIGGAQTVNIVAWDRYNPSQTYRWTSNPISPQPGTLYSLEWVEICASNSAPGGVPALITITPVTDATVLGNNLPGTVTFRIPPNVVGWRGSLRLGASGYNIQIQVDATASTSTSAAPYIHEIHLGYNRTRTSQVE